MSVRFKPIDPVRLKAAVLRASYFEFVKAFWPVVVAETPVWNWHIEYIAGEIQEVLERIFVGKPKEHDLIDNQPPGTSKSLVFSVFQLPWAWTRMPSLRFIGASYSHPLAMQLSRLSRDVVKSDLYRLLFPEVQIRQDQDTKAYFANTAGGTRYAVGANGSVTGLHAHVICIPYEVPVTTDRGDLPIGYVVENRLPVKLLTFDHAAGRTRWQQVQSYGKAPGRPVCKIEFTDGTGLECTHDHPVWNETLGQYVDAETLTPGTQVLYVRRDAAVLHLPEARGPEVVEPEEESGPAGVLRQALLRPVDQCEQDGEEPRPVRQPEAEVRGVREDDRGRTVPGEVQPVLLDEVSGGAAGRDAFPVGRAGQAGVSRVRRGRSGGAVSGGARTVLLQGVCGPGTLGSDDAGEEPAVPGRVLDLSGQPLPAGVHGQTQEPGQGPGEPAVLHLPGGARGRDGAGGPPRRLRQGAQPDAEPGRGLPGVSRGVTRDGVAAPPVGRKTVARVIPHIRLPAAVYNFDVTGDHNYFAAGVLVHNCIDDPLNPNEAASKTQLQQTNFWIGKTLLSRKVDKAVSVVELVMQRLDEDDPTTLMLDKGGCRHLCFPAELHAGYKVRPASAARYYAGGLFDATRLPKKALDESRKELGDVGYAGQYGQNPVPPGGAMFDVTQLTLHDAAQPLPRFVKEVRFWDKAATTEKEDSRAAFTTGVRLARTADGLTYVRDVRRGRWNTAVREKVIRTQARRDGSPVDVGLEQEPGSGGKESAQKTKRMLRGHRVHVVRPTGDKVQRAVPFSVEVNMGRVVLVPGPWNKEYIRELMHFPFGRFKDQVDASAGANSLLDGGLRKAGGIRSKKKTEEIYDPAPPRKKIEKDDD